MNCPYCNNTVPEDAEICPFCNGQLTLNCPYCKERISASDKICPLCGSGLTNKNNIKILQTFSKVLLFLNIIFTIFYSRNIIHLASFLQKNDNYSDMISLCISISVICCIPPIVGNFYQYKQRFMILCIFLNFFLCLLMCTATVLATK